MSKHTRLHFLLFILVARLGFIFRDAFIQKNVTFDLHKIFSTFSSLGPKKTVSIEQETPKVAAQETISLTTGGEVDIQDTMKQKIQNQKENIQDIKTLQSIYTQNKSSAILKEIIKRQAQNYNFDDARSNIQKLTGDSIDIHLFLHIYLNSNNLNITQPESISKVIPILNAALQEGRITDQDFSFYMGLTEIWNKQYQKAFAHWKNISQPEYLSIIQSFKKAVDSYDPVKTIPQYYQDGLVALAALKNGYFTIAKKISLEIIFQNDNYILPYQILSYAHFLTDNRDTAIEYFLKLTNFDKKNLETYQFLIGVSYYWKKDFASSIIYLSQSHGEKYKTDTLRYLIVDYIEIKDYTKAIGYWQQLLGQSDIKDSDFFYYFYTTFYKEYLSKDYVIYRTNKQLASLFIQQCDKTLGVEDNICVYGKVGMELITKQLTPTSEMQLVGLSETYNQSYFYHILGDLAASQQKKDDAKKRYAKTIATSQNPQEIDMVQQKLSTL